MLEQNPAGGEKAKKGSKVTIVVGKFNPDLNPDGARPRRRPRRTAPTP